MHRGQTGSPDGGEPEPWSAGSAARGAAYSAAWNARRTQSPGASLHGPARIARPVGRAWMGLWYQALHAAAIDVGRQLLVM